MIRPVLVAGAGPVGLTMAAELARFRIPVRIVDKASARTDKSKALAVWPRTLELLARAGCADAFAATGLKSSAAAIFAGNDVIAHVPFTNLDYRIIADVGTAPRHDPTLAEVQAIVDRRGPGNVTLSDPVWLSGFGVNERKVDEFRVGRVFVAGDAAHIHSPAGGQGMNTGMHDAVNLAWKLALVERELASAALLDSYSIERSDVARQILSDSGRMIRAATLRGSLPQHVRNFVAHRLLGLAFVQRAVADRLAEITIAYPRSPLNATSGEGLDGAGPAPGERVVDGAPFGSGDTPRFALMAADGADIRAIVAKYSAVLEPASRMPPDARGVWLVRPDGYVAAVARANDTDIIDACLGRFATTA